MSNAENAFPWWNHPTSGETPIIGGETSVTLTSAATLTSLGVTVTPLGSAKVNTSGANPVAEFPITGGTESATADVILHQGSGLELSDSKGSIELHDFRIDTRNGVVDADVTVDGKYVGNLAVFDIGAGDSLTLTSAAAAAADSALGTSAITPSVVIGTADPSPIAYSYINRYFPGLDFLHPGGHGAKPIIGGETTVALTSASTLSSLGVTVTALGSAKLFTHGATPVAEFPITGGTESYAGEVILHQGSGLELSDSTGSIELQDFLIDTKNGVIDANVTVDGKFVGNLAVFDIGSHDTLTLTAAAATAADSALGTSAITTSVVIGTAHPDPVDLPRGIASFLPHGASLF